MTAIGSHLEKNTIRGFVSDKPLAWGRYSEKAQLFIYWDRGRNDKDTAVFGNDYLSRLIDNLFHDREIIDEIMEKGRIENGEKVLNRLTEQMISRLMK